MPGSFQADNCAAAVGICERLLPAKMIKNDVFAEGIEKAFIPGRMEVLSRSPRVVIDGAQNAASAEQLRHSVEKIFKYNRLILILGVSKGKDIAGVCRYLAPMADEIVLTRASVDRAEDPYLIRGYIRNKSRRVVKVTADVTEALGTALQSVGKDDIILATGSFFVIGEIRGKILGGKIR